MLKKAIWGTSNLCTDIDIEYRDVFISPVLDRARFAGVSQQDLNRYLDRVRDLASDISLHLNTQGIPVVRSGLEVKLDYKQYDSKIVILLEILLQDCLLQVVTLEVLPNRNTSLLVGRYAVHPFTLSLIHDLVGIDGVVVGIKKVLPYYECSRCHYSDKELKYCGKGLERALSCSAFKVRAEHNHNR